MPSSGYDTRFLSEDFGAAAAGVLAQAGVRCRLAVAAVPDAHRGPRRPPSPGGGRHHHHGEPQPGLGQRAQAVGTDRRARPSGGDAGHRGARRGARRPRAAADRGGARQRTRRGGGLRAGLPRPVPTDDRPRRDPAGPAARGGGRDARARARLPRPPARGGRVRGHAAPRGPGRHVRRAPAGAGGGAPGRADRDGARARGTPRARHRRRRRPLRRRGPGRHRAGAEPDSRPGAAAPPPPSRLARRGRAEHRHDPPARRARRRSRRASFTRRRSASSTWATSSPRGAPCSAARSRAA